MIAAASFLLVSVRTRALVHDVAGRVSGLLIEPELEVDTDASAMQTVGLPPGPDAATMYSAANMDTVADALAADVVELNGLLRRSVRLRGQGDVDIPMNAVRGEGLPLALPMPSPVLAQHGEVQRTTAVASTDSLPLLYALLAASAPEEHTAADTTPPSAAQLNASRAEQLDASLGASKPRVQLEAYVTEPRSMVGALFDKMRQLPDGAGDARQSLNRKIAGVLGVKATSLSSSWISGRNMLKDFVLGTEGPPNNNAGGNNKQGKTAAANNGNKKGNNEEDEAPFPYVQSAALAVGLVVVVMIMMRWCCCCGGRRQLLEGSGSDMQHGMEDLHEVWVKPTRGRQT